MSSSTIRRKRLEAELEHQRRQARITNQLAEQQRQITTQLAEQERQVATAEFQLRQAELDEEEDERLLALGDQFSDLDPDDNERVQRWLDTEHAQKDNQLETETAHTHSEVADADADSPTAESTAATNQLETETAHTHSEVADADADSPTAESTAATNQLETETAHTHSEVADADADSPTAESTSTAAHGHGSGPDFAAQPEPVSSTRG